MRFLSLCIFSTWLLTIAATAQAQRPAWQLRPDPDRFAWQYEPSARPYTVAADETPRRTIDEPAWGGPVFARGELRQQIEATPIVERPYRPLHFYGNAVRRKHYRGSYLPSAVDWRGGAATLFGGE